MLGDGVVRNRVLFWPSISLSFLLVIQMEIDIKWPAVIERLTFRDKIRVRVVSA